MKGEAVRTERLDLRRWRDDDLDRWAAINADPAVREHLRGLWDRAESAASLARYEAVFDRLGYGLWAVEVRATGTLIGFTGLNPMPPSVPHRGMEIGWRLARDAWGHGYATEAARAAVAYAFGPAGLTELVSMTARANVRSQAVMRRLGMTRDPADDFEIDGVPQVLHRLRRAG